MEVRRRRRRRSRKPLLPLIGIMLVVLAVLIAVAVTLPDQPGDPTLQHTDPTHTVTVPTNPTDPTATEPAPTEPPTEPPIIKESTATLGVVGDILMHGEVIKSGYDSGTKTYNYDNIFPFISEYIQKFDYAVGNMEGTLCGNDNGYIYDGYPHFNCPDPIADALAKAGFDLMLTANNHSYDTRNTGFHRTLEILRNAGMDTLGTRSDADEDNYLIKDLNGIKVGMICYTYNTGVKEDGSIYLNGIPLTLANSQLTNSFNYDDLDGFYAKLSGELEEMEAAGAEATVLFIHWGDEYRLKPNNTQKKMAQALCDLGIDVIVGGHPHVVEPMALLTSTKDENHKTACIYSLGNAVSNQRLGLISASKTAHTEDGLLVGITFAKYSDGSVVVESIDAMPLWVNMNKNHTSSKVYEIVPLDSDLPDWMVPFGLTEGQLDSCFESYNRTMDLIGTGMEEINNWFSQAQADLEEALGVKK